ncbi:MAG: CorA family divalent cation transporter [Pseudomonadota bacterium]
MLTVLRVISKHLDAMREKAVVIQDSVTALLAEQMNRTMLVLSLATAIFLPLGLLTGLLGINVAGIAGAEIPMHSGLSS